MEQTPPWLYRGERSSDSRNEIAKLYQGLELENVVCFAGAEEEYFVVCKLS